MESKTLSKSTVGYGLSYAITCIISSILVPLKEEIGPLKDFMASLTSHHWITHGIFTIAVFFILGVIFTKKNINMDSNKVSNLIIWGTILGGVIVVVYYLIHWFT